MKLRIVEILIMLACVIALVSCANYSNETILREELSTPILITNADGSTESLELQVGQKFGTFRLQNIWNDENNIPEQATFISGNGTHICPVSPIVRGTVLTAGDRAAYLFVVDEGYRHYIPVFDTANPESYIFEIQDFGTALGTERFLLFNNLVDFNERRAYIRIVRVEIFASLYEIDIIDGRFIWLEDFIIHWRLS